MFSTCESQIGVSGEVNESGLWNTKVAAEMYGKSERTIRRLAKDGVIEGYKVEGQFGPEWRIKPNLKVLRGGNANLSLPERENLGASTARVCSVESESEKSDEDKAMIAQLQIRIAEMEQTLKEQKKFDDQRQMLELHYEISELSSVTAESADQLPQRGETSPGFWHSVREVFGRFCSFWVPNTNSNEVA